VKELMVTINFEINCRLKEIDWIVKRAMTVIIIVTTVIVVTVVVATVVVVAIIIITVTMEY
jgi:hypothetical protein